MKIVILKVALVATLGLFGVLYPSYLQHALAGSGENSGSSPESSHSFRSILEDGESPCPAAKVTNVAGDVVLLLAMQFVTIDAFADFISLPVFRAGMIKDTGMVFTLVLLLAVAAFIFSTCFAFFVLEFNSNQMISFMAGLTLLTMGFLNQQTAKLKSLPAAPANTRVLNVRAVPAQTQQAVLESLADDTKLGHTPLAVTMPKILEPC